jgi:hypothetical protein
MKNTSINEDLRVIVIVLPYTIDESLQCPITDESLFY